MLPMAAIAWLSWSAESFARAAAEQKPVLLSLAPSWCAHSRHMDASTYTDETVASVVRDHFVAIRVDADRRPDIGERYSLGGWPTTAFLTPGGALLGGGTFVQPVRLAAALRGISNAFSRGQYSGPRRHPVPERRSEVLPVRQLIDGILDTFDAGHGGFGAAPKFPHAAPVRLALDIHQENGSDRHRAIAMTTLDAMGWGRLYDERDGGFFRCSQDADWGSPNREKLLHVNAAMLDLYITAFERLQLARYLERAGDILRYLQTWLADPLDGGWAGSQCGDPGYYGDGDNAKPPAVDRTLYTDWNAAMVSAALHAGQVMKDPGLSEFAVRSLERLVLLCYRPGGGMAHYFDGAAQVRGLLDDQVAMATAQLDAFDATGNIVYEMLAEELALHAANTMWDGEQGGFFDRAPDESDVGLLTDRLKPFAANCAAARMLDRVAKTSKKPRFAELAARTLAFLDGLAAAEGPLAAEYVLAVRQCGG